ncbi:hypothetical protein RB653_002360 [Dictyostelium firmibasis]|uniref:Peptidase S53 domain-containing protein n=1 Tax=Dictyostelium firmibasis TaxID=79012 RepID=A0AAN7TQE5_9MYCE
MNKINLFIILTILINCYFGINQVNGKFHQELGWKQSLTREFIDPNTPITFRVYIKQQNIEQLKTKVREVSDPSSSKYGHYLSVDDITSIVSPSKQSINLIEQWIQPFNPIDIEFTENQDCIFITMSKQNIEKLMKIRLFKFIHQNGKIILRSPIDPVIPSNLLRHIDLITGISHFPVYKLKNKVNSLSSSSSSSSSEGLQILSIKGTGEFITVEYQPSCAPSCNGKYFPMDVTVTALNQVINNTIVTSNITPTCTVTAGATVCKIFANSFIYQPSQVSITDTVSNQVLAWDHPIVSLPIVLPQTIKEYYGIPNHYQVTHPNATQCVVEFEQQYYSPADLEQFFNSVGLPTNVTVNVIGSNDETNPGVEASLDIQYLMGVAPNAQTTFWSIYANTSAEIDDILQWAVAISTQPNPPLVNSLSYGMTEGNVDTYLGNGYMARSETEFAKLAARGLTVVIASGDSGAYDLGGPPMGANGCENMRGDWPSNSEYVSAVGSIYFTPYSAPICYESVASGGVNCQSLPIGEVGVSLDYGTMWTSGGGFSNFTDRAYYQNDFVTEYLEKLQELNVLPPSNLFNSQGRAYPDFSTVGKNLYVINGGEWLSVDGTSASAPIFAGMVTILNDIRLNKGLPQLGFLNPLFYQIARTNPEAFYDVVVGNNRCGLSDSSPICCESGYTATTGFDTVSGLGRPDMSVLMEIIDQF